MKCSTRKLKIQLRCNCYEAINRIFAIFVVSVLSEMKRRKRLFERDCSFNTYNNSTLGIGIFHFIFFLFFVECKIVKYLFSIIISYYSKRDRFIIFIKIFEQISSDVIPP